MRGFAVAALVFIAAAPTAAFAQSAPAAAASTGYSVEETEIGKLLDDPAAKAVLVKYLPNVVNAEQIEMARSMTLKSIQQYKPDEITDKALADIQTDFNKLPVKK